MVEFHWQTPILIYPEKAQVSSQLPKILEIGPGKGEFLGHLAAQYPQHQIIAIEMKRRRFFKLAQRAAREQMDNVLLFCGNAKEVVPQFLMPQSLDAIHIQFPDPWPKRRHRKHRLLGEETLPLFLSCLKPGGCFHFVTDVDWYAEEVATLFAAFPHCRSLFGKSLVERKSTPEFESYFAQKWKKMGRAFYYQGYKLR